MKRRPGPGLADGVSALIRHRLDEGCEKAWADLARVFDVDAIFPHQDPSTGSTRTLVRALIDDVTTELTKVALATLLLPPVRRRWPPPGAKHRSHKSLSFTTNRTRRAARRSRTPAGGLTVLR